MADDRHDDASQEESSQKHSLATDVETTDIETTRTSETADNTKDDPLQGNWQNHAFATDVEASGVPTDHTDPVDAGDAAADQQAIGEQPVAPPPRSRAALSAVIAAVTGAIAAGLVIGGSWLADWPPSAASSSPAIASAPQVSMKQFGELSNRVASIESKDSRPGAPASDPAAAARVDALEKSVASLRSELAAVRGQSDKLAAALKDAAAAPHDGDQASDLAAVNARLAQVEHQVEQTTQTLAEATKHHAAPAEDVPLRRAMAATLLNVAVRQGQPYGDLLAASKSLVADPDTLKPLEVFADSGVPSSNVLCRELLAVVPKIAPAPPPVMATTGSSIVNRLQEGAARLVHVERIDGSHTESASATVARIAASARQNDLAAAKAELKTLPSADRTAAEPWIARADAHDAALAASRQFATDAMTALTKPAP